MRTFLVAVESVHAGARVADYLGDRLDGDAVHAAVRLPPGADREATRDAEDALNGLRSRLGVVASVETHRLAAEFPAGLLALADEVEADELVVGRGRGTGEESEATWPVAVVRGSTRPTVVVPVE